MTTLHFICPDHGTATVHCEVGIVTCPTCNRVLGCLAQTASGAARITSSPRRFLVEDMAGGDMIRYTAKVKGVAGRTITLEDVRPDATA